MLKSLGYGVTLSPGIFEFPDNLLAARPITGIYYQGSPSLDTFIPASSQSLECLMVNDALKGLPLTIINHLDMYANLRCIGTVTLRSSKEGDVLKAVEPFSVLMHLHTIEMNQIIVENPEKAWAKDYQYKPFQPTTSILQRLGKQHRSLRRIHHVHRPYLDTQKEESTLWEQNDDGVWTSRIIPLVDIWGVINGKLDRV